MKCLESAFAVLWSAGPVKGTVTATGCRLAALRMAAAVGRADGARFDIRARGPARMDIRIADARLDVGAHAASVRIAAGDRSFSFPARDVTTRWPIFLPALGAAVVPADDPRDYAAVADAVRALGARSGLQRIEAEPEETLEQACRTNRNLICPTWLGLGRDMRFFEVGYRTEFGYWGYVQPRYHSVPQSGAIQNVEGCPGAYRLEFVIGPGASCRVAIRRRLEDGVLPILHAVQEEDDIEYRLLAFATLETRPLGPDAVRGTDWRPAYAHTGGNMLTPEEKAALRPDIEAETVGREEEVVLCVRVQAVNRGQVPRYAWFQGPKLQPAAMQAAVRPPAADEDALFGRLKDGRVFSVQRLNGRPLPQPEMAVLVAPGDAAVFEMLLPHGPLPAARARRLARLDVDEHHAACCAFWREKLASAAQISVPELAVDERLRAGLLHCDLVALGREPDGDVLATIGWYAPIGSESAPIIQFFDSMGWHGLAERCLQFFLDRQRPDGFIQNFGGYQLETGPVLWTLGEHYRYTRNKAWVRRVKPNVLRACDYLLAWRERNRRPALKGMGYGLIEGKMADPEDFFHAFMLNAVSHLGLRRAAEMLKAVGAREAPRLAREADAWRRDIRAAFREALDRSPVMPLGDGTWAPAPPPWAEYRGPLALHADGGEWFTHGAFGCRDSLIGPLWLVIGEVLDPAERDAAFALATHHELFTVRNAGLSQPYYARHDYLHLRRDEVKAYLKTYYNQMAALQDRETYTFWEHYFFVSQHKTHEEAWFLMQTRWMLWLEEEDTLHLLRAVPRAWLEQGREIRLDGARSYFGAVSLRVESRVDQGEIRATVACPGTRRPRAVRLRLPHPAGRRAARVEGGHYDAVRETIVVAPFRGRAEVAVRF